MESVNVYFEFKGNKQLLGVAKIQIETRKLFVNDLDRDFIDNDNAHILYRGEVQNIMVFDDYIDIGLEIVGVPLTEWEMVLKINDKQLPKPITGEIGLNRMYKQIHACKM